MHLPENFESTPWLESPLRTPVGTLLLAGTLRNSRGIGSGRMRILGSHALVLLLRGSGRYRDARGERALLSPGDVIHVFPELPHAYGPGPEEEWDEIYVVFEGPVFSTLRQHGLLSGDRPVDRCPSVVDAYAQLKALFDPPERQGPLNPMKALGGFLSFLFETAGNPASGRSGPEEDPVMAMAIGLLTGPQEGRWLTTAETAQRVGLSEETFRKRFARAVGLPPARFQKQKKIERACAALYHGPRSLKQLAADLGFFDEFHFSKAFRQVVGQPPSTYRRRLAGE
ncbi:MAG: AraC family transcriptional regulator [Opitutaceae bacterium]